MSDKVHSPMDYGIVAFANETRAQEFASQKNAKVMSFQAILESIEAVTSSHEHSDS